MKAVVFTMLTLAAATASAETINITSELTRHGEIVSNFSAGVQNGKQQDFRDVSVVEYTDSATVQGGVVKRHKAKLETGFQMSLLPRVSSTGDIIYRLAASNTTLEKMGKSPGGDAAIDLPHTVSDSFVQSRIVKSGEAAQFPFGANGSDDGYVLTVTATRQK